MLHRLMEALDLAVPAGRVGRGDDVTDVLLGEEVAQRGVVRVGPGAVGHQPPRADAAAGKPGQRALDERRDRRGALVCEQLAVGQAGVIVDDGVEVVVAERVAALHLGAPVAGDGVPGAAEARVALDVHVQEITRTWPFVANDLLAPGPRRARATVALEDRADRRVRDAGLGDQQPRAPARPLTRLADVLLDFDRRLARTAVRTAGAIQRPGPAGHLLRGGLPPALLPPPGGAGRDREGGRGRPLGQPFIKLKPRYLSPTRRSEPAPKVLTHPGPPLVWILRKTHSLRTGPDVFSAAHNLPGHVI